VEINFTTPINQTSMGLVGVNLLQALHDQGGEATLWPIPFKEATEAHPKYHDLIRACCQREEKYNKNAPSLRYWHPNNLVWHVGKGAHIGMTVFEKDSFTKLEQQQLQNQDYICVSTRWAEQILKKNNINVPVCRAPYGVDRQVFNENVPAGLPQLGEGNRTVFVNCCKTEIRKGHDILMDAFCKAFEPSDNVHLVVHWRNTFMEEEEQNKWNRIYEKSKMGPNTTILKHRLATQVDVAMLLASADCGVFPSRAEGFNLPALECLAMGKHLIVTNYSGHTEFCNDRNSLLIPFRGAMEKCYDGKWFFGDGQWLKWEKEETDSLVEHMRTIHKRKQSGELQVNAEGVETSKEFSWEICAKKLLGFLSEL
jgi:glycosyltransferase involved in cell wall biosynthesis